MGYKSHAQRKAVWASKKDGGKGAPFKLGTKKKSKRKLEPEFENDRLKTRITDPIHFDDKLKYTSMIEVPETIEEVKKSVPKKEKSPAKMIPTSLRKKRKTQQDVANEARKSRKSYKNKAAEQMAKYRDKKNQAEAAQAAGMTEKELMDSAVTVYGEKKKSPFKLKPKSPLMGKISAACKARAKKKFDVWPSAYASGWGVRCTQGKV